MSFISNLSKNLIEKKFRVLHSSYDSRQTNITNEDKNKFCKIKSVYFNGVEIIDVESYKRYNQEGPVKLEAIENNIINDCKVCNCSMF